MKSKIKIKAISYGRPKNIYVVVEHPDFQIIPEMTFDGIKFPPTSIDYQIDQWFTEQDKKTIIDKYELDCILDWEVYHKKQRPKKLSEVEEFRLYIERFIEDNPTFKRPIEAVLSEMLETIIGKGMSSSEKMLIVLSSIHCTLLGAEGAFKTINDIFDSEHTKNKDFIINYSEKFI